MIYLYICLLVYSGKIVIYIYPVLNQVSAMIHSPLLNATESENNNSQLAYDPMIFYIGVMAAVSHVWTLSLHHLFRWNKNNLKLSKKLVLNYVRVLSLILSRISLVPPLQCNSILPKHYQSWAQANTSALHCSDASIVFVMLVYSDHPSWSNTPSVQISSHPSKPSQCCLRVSGKVLKMKTEEIKFLN